MFKYFVMLLLLSNSAFSCEKVYVDGRFIGCKIPKYDRVLNTVWSSTIYNNYNGQQVVGDAVFKIDKTGRYEAKSYTRNSFDSCIKPPDKGWTGQLYKIAPYKYIAYNTGNNTEYYVLNVSMDYKTASSTLLNIDSNFTETNVFYRRPKNYTEEDFTYLLSQNYCN